MAKLILLLVAGFVVGCATAPIEEDVEEFHTFEEWQKIYEAEDRKIQREDELVSYVKNCHERGHVIFYKKWGGRISKPLIDRHGQVNLPKHAHAIDFFCLTSRDAQLLLRQLTGGGRYGRRQ